MKKILNIIAQIFTSIMDSRASKVDEMLMKDYYTKDDQRRPISFYY